MAFDFVSDTEGWVYTNPPIFATTLGTYEGNDEALAITATSNVPLTGSFGFWESPTFAILGSPTQTAPEGTIGISGGTGLRSMYRTTFSVSGDVSPALAPTLRLRSSSSDFQQSDVLVITSMAEGALSPGSTMRNYSQLFSQPEDVSMFRLDFDLLNVDPADAATATFLLHRVSVEAAEGPDTESGSTVQTFNFADSAANGFTLRTAPPLPPAQVAQATERGLLLQGIPTDSSDPNTQRFSFWGIESDLSIAGNSLYRVAFRVSSTATSENGAMLPVFRMRINDSSLQYSAYVNVDSRHDGLKGHSRVPVDGASELYYLYFTTPAEIAGNTFIFSFDYLYTPDSNDDPSLGVVLERLEVERFPMP